MRKSGLACRQSPQHQLVLGILWSRTQGTLHCQKHQCNQNKVTFAKRSTAQRKPKPQSAHFAEKKTEAYRGTSLG